MLIVQLHVLSYMKYSRDIYIFYGSKYGVMFIKESQIYFLTIIYLNGFRSEYLNLTVSQAADI